MMRDLGLVIIVSSQGENSKVACFVRSSLGMIPELVFLNSPNTSVHKIGAQRGARGAKNNKGDKCMMVKARTYDLGCRCSSGNAL